MARRKTPKPTAEEDSALWEAVKATVTPGRRDTVFRDSLEENSDAVPPKAPKLKKHKPAQGLAPAAGLVPLTDLPLPKPAQPRDLRHGCAPGVDRRTAERLKKGRMEIEARLDLHGMSREAAHHATDQFVIAAHRTGKRCVLIVTGKGKGILQTELPRWLNLAHLRPHILSFNHARPQDGGSGAVYVLLRRDRGR